MNREQIQQPAPDLPGNGARSRPRPRHCVDCGSTVGRPVRTRPRAPRQSGAPAGPAARGGAAERNRETRSASPRRVARGGGDSRAFRRRRSSRSSRSPLVIEPDGLDKAPTIVATQKDRVILAAGNTAYVRGIAGAGEETWYVYRQGAPLVDPDTEQTLAYEAIYLGTAQVTSPGESCHRRADECGAGSQCRRQARRCRAAAADELCAACALARSCAAASSGSTAASDASAKPDRSRSSASIAAAQTESK